MTDPQDFEKDQASTGLPVDHSTGTRGCRTGSARRSRPAHPASDRIGYAPGYGKKELVCVKVTAGREESIRDAIERRIKIEVA